MFSFCSLAQTNNAEIILEINNLLKSNPNDDGYYCTISLKNEKLIVDTYDNDNNYFSRDEAYKSDLNNYFQSTDFSKIKISCDGENECVKSISILGFNLNLHDPTKWIKSINETTIKPEYRSVIVLYFKPDSRLCKKLLDLIMLL